jgi:hypothetical protein
METNDYQNRAALVRPRLWNSLTKTRFLNSKMSLFSLRFLFAPLREKFAETKGKTTHFSGPPLACFMAFWTKNQSRNAVCAALALGCAGLAATASRAAADDVLSGFYLSTDAGLNLVSDLNAPDVSVSLRPGVRGDATMGRAWELAGKFSVATELDAGVLYNTLDKATTPGQSTAVGGSLTDVPLLGHAVLRWQFHPHWIAYAGAGVGCTFSSLRLDADGSNYGLGGTDVDFAWQTMAGIRYRIGSSELGLGYDYFSFKRSDLQTIGNNTILVSYTFCF